MSRPIPFEDGLHMGLRDLDIHDTTLSEEPRRVSACP